MNANTVTEFRLKLYPKDFPKVRAFYEEGLGFQVINQWDRGDTDKGVMLQVGPAILELLSPEDGYEQIKGVDLSLEVSNVWGMHEVIKDEPFIARGIVDNPWGDTSFSIVDPEGFGITFFTKRKEE
ncbi:MAG: lactoylglutathione lyase [Candidatus Saccharibacteria bacterium]|nr:lactoylglutathione lyase [Candidatus Saccharibacteria bacterium]